MRLIRQLLILLLLFTPWVFCEASVPAHRIISLSPSITELIYAAGAGQFLIAVDTASDFPAAARGLTKIASYPAINIESLILLKPDLVIADDSVYLQAQLEQLKSLGINVYIINIRRIEDIPNAIIAIGKLANTHAQAKEYAEKFQKRYLHLKSIYKNRSKIKVFYELWPQPLLTVSRTSIINQVIEECGGENIFAASKGEAPEVNIELVLKNKPEVIIFSSPGDAGEWKSSWLAWASVLPAAKNNQLYEISPDLLTRHGPRLLQGMEKVCQALDKGRGK